MSLIPLPVFNLLPASVIFIVFFYKWEVFFFKTFLLLLSLLLQSSYNRLRLKSRTKLLHWWIHSRKIFNNESKTSLHWIFREQFSHRYPAVFVMHSLHVLTAWLIMLYWLRETKFFLVPLEVKWLHIGAAPTEVCLTAGIHLYTLVDTLQRPFFNL